MKLKGQVIKGPNIETIVLPRGEGEPIVLRAQAVLDYDGFEKLCPKPIAPKKVLPGGRTLDNVEDPIYVKQVEEHAVLRTYWMFLQSLRATPDLEWETIKYDEPDTWKNFENELKNSGFSGVELMRVQNGIMAANCLDEQKIEKARASFLRDEVAQQGK